MKEIISFIVDILMTVVFFILKILGFLFKYILLPILKFLLFIGCIIGGIIKEFCSYSLSTYGNYGYILIIPLLIFIAYIVIKVLDKVKDIYEEWGNENENDGFVLSKKYEKMAYEVAVFCSGGPLVCDTPEYKQRQEQLHQERLLKDKNKNSKSIKTKTTYVPPAEAPKCVFCNGPATVGIGCGFSPYKSKIHARAPDGKHCVYCGGKALGPGCGFSPTKNHSRVLIY